MIEVLIGLAVLGLVAYLILTFVPMAEPIRSVVIGVMVLFLCLWLLSVFGIVDMPALR